MNEQVQQHSSKIGERAWTRKPGELLGEVKRIIRLKHYSISTEHTYTQWITRFVEFSGNRHPLDMGEAEVEAYLSHLAIERNVAGSTQNQAA